MNEHDSPPLIPIGGSSETHSNERRVVFAFKAMLWSVLGFWFLIAIAGIIQAF
jgi:hypothetical protein